MLPVTVRNVEPSLQGQNLGGRRPDRCGSTASDGEIAEWLRTVDSADDYDVDEIKQGRRGHRPHQPYRREADPDRRRPGAPMKIGLPGKGKDFEVVGIPLTKPGFYVVELASPVLGQALLGRNAPRYVATAALVTNMAVHFKWGRERSLAWVTSLDSGKPVANAAVTVTDSCTGKLLAQRQDRPHRAGCSCPPGCPSPKPMAAARTDRQSHPLMISARARRRFQLHADRLGRGHPAVRFRPALWLFEARATMFHTVFDRALVRQGETIHMKHIVRQPIGAGFAIGAGLHRHAAAVASRIGHAVRPAADDRRERHRRDRMDRAAGRADGRLRHPGDRRGRRRRSTPTSRSRSTNTSCRRCARR